MIILLDVDVHTKSNIVRGLSIYLYVAERCLPFLNPSLAAQRSSTPLPRR